MFFWAGKGERRHNKVKNSAKNSEGSKSSSGGGAARRGGEGRLLPGEPSQRRRCAVRTAFGRVGTCQAKVLFTTKSFYAFSVSSAKLPCQCPKKAKQRPQSQPYRPKDSNCFFCFPDIFQAALLFPAPAQSSDFMESFQSCPFHFLI